MPQRDPQQRRAYDKHYREQHRERHRVVNREYSKTHRKYLSAQRQLQRQRNPALANLNREKERMRHYHQQKPAFYYELFSKQNGRCAICGVPSAHLKVDHDHKTGCLRGLLCHSCNVGISWFQDNPMLLKNAASYLSQEPKGNGYAQLLLEL